MGRCPRRELRQSPPNLSGGKIISQARENHGDVDEGRPVVRRRAKLKVHGMAQQRGELPPHVCGISGCRDFNFRHWNDVRRSPELILRDEPGQVSSDIFGREDALCMHDGDSFHEPGLSDEAAQVRVRLPGIRPEPTEFQQPVPVPAARNGRLDGVHGRKRDASRRLLLL